MAWASAGRMPWVHGLAGQVVGPTRWLDSHAATGPGCVSGMVPRWHVPGWAGRGEKMRAMKDGPDAVGSCLSRLVLTMPRIAPALKMFANSRVGV
jgi:hypothetical protein